MTKARYFLITILSLVLLILILRQILPTEIDDISPGIPCPEIAQYNPDILWVIPKYQNISIAENQTWCQEIIALNKTLGLHGVYHTYNEFQTNRSSEYLKEGIQIFEECFGFTPTKFKPPQLKISEENKQLIEQNNLKLELITNQLIHKVYHCNDSDIIKNWLVRVF